MKNSSILFFLLFGLNSFGQFHTNLSKSEVGIFAGGSYYIGDLNPVGNPLNSQFAAGLIYRYNIHSRLSFRANFLYGKVVGDDALSSDLLLQNRNLSFRSDIWELAAGVEFNYFPFQLGHDRYKGTAYILAQIGVFNMNPQANFNGDWVDLQALGTEGQGTPLGSANRYSLYQICIPIGFGFRISLGKAASLEFEYGIRKTFTDNLDDVRLNSFVDPDDLIELNGPLATTLSNRSLDGNRFGKRGNSATKDWYVFYGLALTFHLGKPKVCYSH